VEKDNKETIEGFRLSPQQARLWLLQQSDQRLPYDARAVVLIEGSLDRRLLEAALEQVVGRHEILRTTFRCLPAMTLPLQVISEKSRVAVQNYDFNGQGDHLDVAREPRALPGAPFDLESGPLLQTAVAQLAPEQHLLLLSLPALCADAAGLSNLVRELSLCYASCLGMAELPDEPVQYADLAEWQNELLESEGTEARREYWRKQALAELLALKLPFENRRAEKAGADRVVLQSLPAALDRDLASRIKALVDRSGTSLPVFLLGCWQILLRRLTGQPEIVVGASYDGRNYEELQGALGLFEHYLPIGCRPEENLTFVEFLKQLDELAREAHAWQECFSWEQIEIDGYKGEGVPFFPYCFEFGDKCASYKAGPVTFSISHQSACIDRFKLKLTGLGRPGPGDALSLALHYDSRLFRRDDIARMAEQYMTLLGSAVATPEAALTDLKILSQAERAQILRRFNPAPPSLPPAQVIHQMIAAQEPKARAVVVEEQELSYGELNRRANQLAHYLQKMGVGPEVLVGLCLERSVDLVVGMLGILKAGGAYLPLDPGLPAERLAGMVADAQPRVLLTQRDRETERRRDGETERRRDGETERWRDRETERQRDRELSDGETERQRESDNSAVSPSLRLSVSPSLRLSVSPSLRLSVSPSLRLPSWCVWMRIGSGSPRRARRNRRSV